MSSFTKTFSGINQALLGEEKNKDDDSQSGNDVSEQESMFGNDVNKKTGKPTRGLRWMIFTFVMIFLLCLITMFFSKYKDLRSKAIKIGKDAAAKV